MYRTQKARAAFIVSILAYFLIASEIVIMISPFAAYFFSVYTPVLESLAKQPRLAWTTDFFLPHLVFTGDRTTRAVAWLQMLFLIGNALFLWAALPLYYSKIFRKKMAQRGPYALVRHPQYLALAIAGFGLLIYWPRFIILLLYVAMLFIYYALARNEEWRCRRQYGAPYEEYLKKTPMFIPGEPGGKLYRALFGWMRPKWAGMVTLYLIVLLGSGFAAAALRAHSEKTITKYVFTSAMGIPKTSLAVVPVYPCREKDILNIVRAVMENDKSGQTAAPGINMAYVMPADFFLMAVITEEPRRLDVNNPKFHSGLIDFFKIFFNYFEGVEGKMWSASAIERVIFVEVTGPRGETVRPEDALGLGLTRTPRALADIDLITGKVLEVKELGGGNKWGRAPMPAF